MKRKIVEGRSASQSTIEYWDGVDGLQPPYKRISNDAVVARATISNVNERSYATALDKSGSICDIAEARIDRSALAGVRTASPRPIGTPLSVHTPWRRALHRLQSWSPYRPDVASHQEIATTFGDFRSSIWIGAGADGPDPFFFSRCSFPAAYLSFLRPTPDPTLSDDEIFASMSKVRRHI
jgi:hypothetical protein